MVDLHSHILPNMDDGPRKTGDSLRLIGMEADSRVDTIVLTPHYRYGNESVEAFLKRRENSLRALKQAAGTALDSVRLLLGAEVALSPVILEREAAGLCIEGTDYLLLELPWDCWPAALPDMLYRMRLNGVIPLIAHVERYDPVIRDPGVLRDMVSAGTVTQVNASSLCGPDRKARKRVCSYIQNNLVHVIASDAHSVTHRPPLLKEAVENVEKRFDRRTAAYLIENSRIIAENGEIPMKEPTWKDSFLSRVFKTGQ